MNNEVIYQKKSSPPSFSAENVLDSTSSRRSSYVSPESALYDGDFGNSKTPIKGGMLDLALGVVQNLANDWFKGQMQKELDNMPMPTWDRRLTSNYWLDPSTSSNFNVIHMFHQDLPRFGKALQEQQQALIRDSGANIMKIMGFVSDQEERVYEIGLIRDRQMNHFHKLLMVKSNLEVALSYEKQSLEAAEAAEELEKGLLYSSTSMVTYDLYKPNQISAMMANLRMYAHMIRNAFKNVNDLLATLQPLIEEADHALSQIGDIYLAEFYLLLKKKEREMKQNTPNTQEDTESK